MYFTLDDYRKIEEWLKHRTIKDTEFPEATSLTGKEQVPIIQDDTNKVLPLDNLIREVSLESRDCFNINSVYNIEEPITLDQAISLVPERQRKLGLIITYKTTYRGNPQWELQQFIGTNISDWTNQDNWTSLRLTLLTVISSIITSKGQPNGIATLDNNGKLSSSQIPFGNTNDTVPSGKDFKDLVSRYLQSENDIQDLYGRLDNISEETGTLDGKLDDLNDKVLNLNPKDKARLDVGTYQAALKLPNDEGTLESITFPAATNTSAGLLAGPDKVKVGNLPDNTKSEISRIDSSVIAVSNRVTSNYNTLNSKITTNTNNLKTLTTTVNTILDNPSEAIDSLNEIKDFLQGVEDTNLEEIITSINTNVNTNVSKEEQARAKADEDIMATIVKLHAIITATASKTTIYKGESNSLTITTGATFDGKPLAHTVTVDGAAKKESYTLSDGHNYNVAFNINNADPKISTTINKTIQVLAYYPRYYGLSTNREFTAETLATWINTGQDKVHKMPASGSPIASNITINNDVMTRYIWCCVPDSMHITKVTSAGFDVPMEDYISVTLAGKGTYKCYRSTKQLNIGSVTFSVQ